MRDLLRKKFSTLWKNNGGEGKEKKLVSFGASGYFSLVRVVAIKKRWLAAGLAWMFLGGWAPADSAKPPEPAAFSLTAEEQAWLAEHSEIRIGVMADYPPFHYADRQGHPVGMGVDLLREVEKRLGVPIRLESGVFAELLDKVREGALDGVMDVASCADPPAHLVLTQPYFVNPQVIVAKRGGRYYRTPRMLSGSSLAVEKGFCTEAWFQENHPKVRLRRYDSTAEALDGVARGEAVAYAGLRAVSLALLEREMLSNMHLQGRLDRAPVGLCLGVRREAPELAGALDRALGEVLRTQGRVLRAKWFERTSRAGGRLELNAEQQEWLAAEPSIRVGVPARRPPMSYVDEEGRPRGIGVDLVALLNERLDAGLELVAGSRAELLDALRAGRIEALMDYVPSLDAGDAMQPTRPYANIPYVIAGRKGGDFFDSLEALRKRTVAVEAGSPVAEHLRRAHPRIRRVEHESVEEALAAVSAGHADAYVGRRAEIMWLTGRGLLSNLQVQGTVREIDSVVAFGVRGDLPHLGPILNAAMGALPPESVQEIFDEWGGAGWSRSAEISWIQLTPEEKRWLEENPVILVGSNPRWAPLEFTDKTGQFQGMTYDYLERFGRALGVTFRHVAIPSWRQAQAKLRDGEVDLLTSLNRASARRTDTEFTTPFLALPAAIFTHENKPIPGDVSDLRDQKVGVVIGYGLEDYLRAQVPGIRIDAIRHVPMALAMLESGELDAYVGSLLVTSHYIQQGGHARIKVAGELDFTYHPAFAVRGDTKILVQILNKALAGIDEQTKSAIAREWMSVVFEKHIDYTKLYKYAAGILALMGLFAYWNRRMAAEIRRRRAVEASLRKSEEALQAANKELEAFSYSVSHDLRAPLRHVAGFVQLLQSNAKDKLDATGLRYIEVIAGAAKRMGELIDDLLSFSRTGRAQMNLETVPLGPLVDECRKELELEMKGRAIDWQIGELPEVQADRPLLRQVMANLLGNAVKYSGKREVARIEITSRRENGEIIVCVRDNGAGFDMKYADKLFGVFQRLHSESEFEGTGIGLANVRRIIVRHGGRTWAEGEVDQGAAFSFSLPDPSAAKEEAEENP